MKRPTARPRSSTVHRTGEGQTDDAFAKLPKQTLSSLLKPENREQLQRILKFHVVTGRYPAERVLGKKSLDTLAGAPAKVEKSESGATIAGANIVKTDVMASNGIIHVIDSVMMPPAPQPDIVDLAANAGQFGTLITAVKAAGLETALRGEGPFTVFAPTDAAFAKLPKATLESLLRPENKAKLQSILKYHVVSGAVDARSAIGAGNAKTLQGSKVEFGIDSGRITVDGANVIANDLGACNGVVHVIDTVILPD